MDLQYSNWLLCRPQKPGTAGSSQKKGFQQAEEAWRLGGGQPRGISPDDFTQAFLRDQLAQRGLSADQVSNLRFVCGLDKDANAFTRFAFPSAEATTQGNTVYVKPERYSEIVGFQSATPFEEAYHAAQFADEGNDRFYPHYTLGSVGGILSGLGSYTGNIDESFAGGASRRMFEDYKAALKQKLLESQRSTQKP